MRWASHEKPAIFYSIAIGCVGPVLLVVVPPIRRYFGDGPREKIPLTYPSKRPDPWVKLAFVRVVILAPYSRGGELCLMLMNRF